MFTKKAEKLKAEEKTSEIDVNDLVLEKDAISQLTKGSAGMHWAQEIMELNKIFSRNLPSVRDVQYDIDANGKLTGKAFVVKKG